MPSERDQRLSHGTQRARGENCGRAGGHTQIKPRRTPRHTVHSNLSHVSSVHVGISSKTGPLRQRLNNNDGEEFPS